jgi:hypothetical protein
MAAFALPAIGAAASLISGFLGSKAAQNAKDAQVAALRNAIDTADTGRDQALATQRDVYNDEKKAAHYGDSWARARRTTRTSRISNLGTTANSQFLAGSGEQVVSSRLGSNLGSRRITRPIIEA